MNEITKNCECCLFGYSSGKNYGNSFGIPMAYDKNGNLIPPKGLCPKCNIKSDYFTCKKHGEPFKIGHFWYRPENNFEKFIE